MATEPQAASSTAPSWSDSPIENELPTYRAISSWAVASLVLGMISLVSFASLSFVIASVAAIGCGAAAQRAIRRYPDLVTGTGLANLGITLGLVSGLAAPTLSAVQHSIISRQAREYSTQLVAALESKGMADAYWLGQHPEIRAQMTPQGLMTDIENTPEQEMAGPDTRLSTFRTISQRLASGDQHIHFDEIEGRGFSGTTPFAYVRVMLDGPESEEFPAVQYALFRVEGADFEGQRQWYIKDIVFPYEAGTRANVVESAHGHEH
ncbi:DUF4190 domain-containing protein [Tautonia marina]|uniref:DUF4190 domain-containing protein n=1 Tax=Tautonia marina TaxID=2653855 RepID=UPI001375D569|nr:DUF4190 domain-containing protein [Tautonia marina]